MEVTAPRRFTILDAMILTAATALGLSFMQVVVKREPFFVPWLSYWQVRGYWIQNLIAAMAFPITAATMALALRSPGERLRRLTTRPGFVACLAVVVAHVAHVVMIGIAAKRHDVHPSRWWRSCVLSLLYAPVSADAVAVAWALLVVGGRWRPVRSWIDRSGRALGGYWLVSGFVMPFFINL